MTTRELRSILFNLKNQDMTVEQLRTMLFDVQDQDAELVDGFGTFRAIEAQEAARLEKAAELDAYIASL